MKPFSLRFTDILGWLSGIFPICKPWRARSNQQQEKQRYENFISWYSLYGFTLHFWNFLFMLDYIYIYFVYEVLANTDETTLKKIFLILFTCMTIFSFIFGRLFARIKGPKMIKIIDAVSERNEYNGFGRSDIFYENKFPTSWRILLGIAFVMRIVEPTSLMYGVYLNGMNIITTILYF